MHFHSCSFMVLCRECHEKSCLNLYFWRYFLEGWKADSSCAQHSAVPPCGHLNILLRSRKLWMIVQWCLNSLSGVGGHNTNPSPCNVFSSPHANYRICELTDVVITVFKLEGFYFLKLLQDDLSAFPKAIRSNTLCIWKCYQCGLNKGTECHSSVTHSTFMSEIPCQLILKLVLVSWSDLHI